MNSTFGHKTYDLNYLIDQIKIGTIALPELQRPFLWEKSKVRDLFDSLYKGLPVGYFLLWETFNNGSNTKSKNIGTNEKLAGAKFLVIDGQQRLTSLYAVMKGEKVINKDFKEEKIIISFNPFNEKFEVYNPAIGKDIDWLDDISRLFNADSKHRFVQEFIDKVKGKKDLTIDEENKISNSFSCLEAIVGFNMTVLELVPTLDVEQVSEIFVRINSKGVVLKQSDFISTLMSVYWEEGRKELEKFCENAKKIPEGNEPTPYNGIAKPLPENIIRTAVGYAFLRGRLRYAYLTLQGKNLEDKNSELSSELRGKNFKKLKEAQELALDLTNWHDFINLISSTGFVNEYMIPSKTALYITYSFYLIGKFKFKIPYKELNRIIKKWFFFSILTSRYTGSPESAIEQDLNIIAKSKTFIEPMETIFGTTLTSDYWDISLPQALVSSSSLNNAYLVFLASQNILDVYIPFSDIKQRDVLKVGNDVNFKKNPIDKHHLFPKAYLAKNGIESLTDQNQVGNYVYLEYKDNITISDNPPKEYWKTLTKNFNEKEIDKIKDSHAIPEEFPNINYEEFLAERRKLMAHTIKKAFIRI